MATRTENFELLLKGTEKNGRSKREEVAGERAEPREKAFELCDDDSRTIIDGEELFAAAAAAAAADGVSPSGSGVVSAAAFQEIVAGREENPKSFEISVAAKDGVALRAAGRPRKRGRKRKGVTMIQQPIDETKRADEKRAKIEDDSNEFVEPFGTESQKADDEKVPELLNKSPEEDDTAGLNGRSIRLGKDEKGNADSKEVDKLNENHQDRSETMKLWPKEISDDNADERNTDTKPATVVSYGSEEFRNPLKDQSDRREDKFSSFLIQSTLFTSQKEDFDSKQSQNGRYVDDNGFNISFYDVLFSLLQRSVVQFKTFQTEFLS